MSKERFLTVMVPIKDSDCEPTVYASLSALESAVTPSSANTNKIYKVSDGTYYRSLRDTSSGVFSYNEVTEREFPYLGDPLTIYDFTYDATRMGVAPTITAQNVMRFAEKDSEGDDVTLDGMWSSECFVRFNGAKFYLRRTPSSSKSNDDARYKYDMEFVSERVILESVYIYDVVQPYIYDRPVSENSSFSFFGDINALATRINASLIQVGLAKLQRKYVPYPTNPSYIVPYLTYSQWTTFSVDISLLVQQGVFANMNEAMVFYQTIYTPLSGDYTQYLMEYIYVNENGNYVVNGYKCVIGKDKKGVVYTSEEKLVTFENNTIYEALQQFHETFEVDYYITMEKDNQGAFTGNTLIMVADCEHDFADWDSVKHDYVRGDDNIPTSTHPFDYGATEQLLAKEKNAKTDKLITRITGVGSNENVPWHYPNPTPDGWIKPILKSNGEEQPSISIEYPTSEGSTIADSIVYEKFLKNRIGNVIKYGTTKEFWFETDYYDIQGGIVSGGLYTKFCKTEYRIQKNNLTDPRITFSMYYPYESGCGKFTAQLISSNGTVIGSYDSASSYPNPTDFQMMCATRDGSVAVHLQQHAQYILKLEFFFASVPLSKRVDYEGYHYQSVTQGLPPNEPRANGYVGENFYDESGLTEFIVWHGFETSPLIVIDYAGYSTNGELSGRVAPLPRYQGKQYKDVESGTIYLCIDGEASDKSTGEHQNAFSANPEMGWDEWVDTFLNMRIYLFEADGWYLGNKNIDLSDYGLGTPTVGGSDYSAEVVDTIEFKRTKYVTPQPNLMPELYIKTDGERRFYKAHNYYPLQEGTADTALGEQQEDVYVINPIYKENETDTDDKHYDFENEYENSLVCEHIENFNDIKPSIEGQTNIVDGNVIRIDVVEEFGYDMLDSDEIWESNDNGSLQGDYKHPYFFAKLRPLGFNIFDLALQEDMVISMKTGKCGACNFKIGVDDKTLKNPVQLWEYDVYGGQTFESKGEKLYSAMDLRRYVNIDGLYYDTDNTESGYKPVRDVLGIGGGDVNNEQEWSDVMFSNYVYTKEQVANGEVGVTKINGNYHFEGDVVTQGRFMDSQQDTSENYVWVALMKDIDTYGVVMPSAKGNYAEDSLNTYIRPSAIADVHTPQSTSTQDEDNADKFVLLNIRMPQVYLRRAERKLSHELVKYMYEHNWQKFDFSIKFSRIYLEQHPNVNDSLNENSVLYVLFNKNVYRQYIKHYTYRMSNTDALPEITVEANDELPVSVTLLQKQEQNVIMNNIRISNNFGSVNEKIKDANRNKGESYSSETTIIQSNEWEEF